MLDLEQLFLSYLTYVPIGIRGDKRFNRSADYDYLERILERSNNEIICIHPVCVFIEPGRICP